MHRFDVLTIKTFELRRKTTKVIKLYCIASIWRLNDQKLLSYVPTLQKWSNYKSNQSTMNCIDLTSKRSKKLSYVPNYKVIKYNGLHRFDIKSFQNVEILRKTFKTTQTNESDQTTKVIKAQWIASIWHQNNPKCWDTSQNIQNNAKLRK